MSDTLLITATDVRKYTPISGSVDNDYVEPAIKVVQDVQLEEMLGYNLKAKLIELKDAGTLTTTSPYDDLFSTYVKPWLIWIACQQATESIRVDMSNKGIMNKSSEQGVNVTQGDFEIIRRTVGKTADQYKKKLYNHLCRYSSRYPEYVTNQDGRQNPTATGRPWGIYNW